MARATKLGANLPDSNLWKWNSRRKWNFFTIGLVIKVIIFNLARFYFT